MPDRPLRADARRNREQVLRAAREAFAESGYGVPLDEIAARAGVGPGTVYRHFPAKEALFQAVVTARIEDLLGDARARADNDDPGGAFFGFLGRVAEEAAAKRDLPDAIAIAGSLRRRCTTRSTCCYVAPSRLARCAPTSAHQTSSCCSRA